MTGCKLKWASLTHQIPRQLSLLPALHFLISSSRFFPSISAIPHSCNCLGNMLNNNKKNNRFFFFTEDAIFLPSMMCVCVCVHANPKKMPHLLHLPVSGAFQVWHTTEVDIFSSIFISACTATVASCSRRRAPEPHSFLQKSVTSRGRLLCFRQNARRWRRRQCRHTWLFVLNHAFVR